MIDKILIKNLPVNTEFISNPRTNNIVLGIDKRLKIFKIKSKLTPNKIQARFSWLKENEPEKHYQDIIKIFKKIIKNNTKIIGLTYRDEKFISLLKKKSNLKMNYLDRRFYKIQDYKIGLSRIQDKISKKEYLVKAFKGNEKKIILMNHSLHHFINLKKFLLNLHQFINKEDIIYIEVPDCEKYFKGFDYTHIFEEHNNYFTKDSLENVLKSNSFKVLKFYRYKNKYEDSLNFWIKKDYKKVKSQISFTKEIRYIQNFKKSKKKIQDFFKKNNSKKIGILGAGHHTVSFINIFELQRFNFTIYDDNKFKKDKYLPGTKFLIKKTSNMSPLDLLLIGVSPDKEENIMKKIQYKNFKMKSINPLSKYYFL